MLKSSEGLGNGGSLVGTLGSIPASGDATWKKDLGLFFYVQSVSCYVSHLPMADVPCDYAAKAKSMRESPEFRSNRNPPLKIDIY